MVEDKPAVEPEIRRAQLPDDLGKAVETGTADELNLVEAKEAAEQLWAALLKAENFNERAVLIADAEEQKVEIEGYFENDRPVFGQFKLAKVVPRMLPGQHQVPLFQLMTESNPKTGAFLRLAPQENGGFLLDWPLFAETVEGRLVRFLKLQSEEPSWFHVLLRRSHGLELAEEARAGQLCFSLHVNGQGPETSLAQVAMETPLGRFFEREVEWGEAYVSRLLLQHRPGTGGTNALVILDCEGAVTGAVFPGGGWKR